MGYMLLSEEEIKKKKVIWEKMHGPYVQRKKEKDAAAAAKPRPKKRSRRSTKAVVRGHHARYGQRAGIQAGSVAHAQQRTGLATTSSAVKGKGKGKKKGRG